MKAENMTAEECRIWADELQRQLHVSNTPGPQRDRIEVDLEKVYARWESL